MASTSVAATHCYRFQVLRYVPNLVSGEYFNIGLLLRDGENQLIDARFAAARGFVDEIVSHEKLRESLVLLLRAGLRNPGAHLGPFGLGEGLTNG